MPRIKQHFLDVSNRIQHVQLSDPIAPLSPALQPTFVQIDVEKLDRIDAVYLVSH